MTSEAWRIKRGAGAALLALAFILVAAVPTAHADTIYPDNEITGSHFSTGLAHPPGGSAWTEFENTCTILAGLLPAEDPQVCQTHTSHAAGIGTPPGSMQQSYNGTADGLAPLLFESTATARSSTFTIGPNLPGATGKATFQFDRRADVATILDLEGQATFRFTLVDLTAGSSQELWFEELDDSDNDFLGRLNDGATHTGIPGVIPTHTYRIDLTTVFNCAIVCAGLQETVANFDNIRLRVEDGTALFGPATATTTDATEIGGTTATLNGITNAQDSPSTYAFHYGTTMAMTLRLPAVPPDFNAGSGRDDQVRSRAVAGLAPCTQYFFQIEAQNAQNDTPSLGGIKSFVTDCAPLATTLEATGVGPNAATLNSAITPRGADTTYFYEYGLDSLAAGVFETRIPLLAAGNFPSIGEGYAAVQPNSAVIGGLTPETIYRARVTAVNAVGAPVAANTVTFRTPGVGAQGIPGTNGTNGTNGANGADGAQGPQGPAGNTGSTGAVGPRGPAGDAGRPGEVLNINNGDPRALIRIYGQSIVVPRRGRNIGRVRVKIFCRTVAVLTCSGNMKVRSLNVIRPQSFGARPTAKRRVTFATDAVQLDVRKIGFAILNFNAQRRSVLRREKSVRSTVIVTVIDAANNRQNIRAVLPVRLSK